MSYTQSTLNDTITVDRPTTTNGSGGQQIVKYVECSCRYMRKISILGIVEECLKCGEEEYNQEDRK